MNKSLVFTPGCKWEVKSGVLFIEYESMTGEPVRARFDLSPETQYITDGYKLEEIKNICEHSDDFFIQKVEYYEIENHMLVGGKMLVPTKVYFEAKAKKTAEKTHDKLLRQVANSAYGIASRDWGDVLADSARYIHMQQSRCSGKTLWLSSATSFADKQPLWDIFRYHDICEQWLKEPPTPYEFISDDLEDCEKGVPNTKLIDPTTGDTVKEIKKFEEEIKMAEKTRFDMYKPTVKKVIFSDPATIVFWTDNTKTIVKCGENDIYDPEKGVAMCCMKKLLGTNKTGSNYLDNNETLRGVKRHIQKWEEDNRKEAKSMAESIEKEFEAVTNDDWTVVPADENTTAEENGE